MSSDKGSPSEIISADLAIVGAGPAGSAAAIEGTRSGLNVVVIDKATFPRQKCCGDGLTTGALRHLEELGFDPASVPSWQPVQDVTLVSPKGTETTYHFPTERGMYAAAARRSELDHALVQLATDAGATVLQGHTLTAIEVATTSSGRSHQAATLTAVRGDGTTVQVRAPMVLAADGMWSPTRKLLGMDTGGYRGEWHAFRQYFTGVSERASRELIVWFDPDLLPGYIWSFPIAGPSTAGSSTSPMSRTANVGFGILRQSGQSVQAMGKLWPEVLARPEVAAVLGPDATPEGTHRAWPIPARLGKLPLASGPVLFIGDAAAATDPMSGEGIGQAIETGRLAANLFTLSGGDPAETAERYERTLRQGMIRDHGLARALSTVLAKPLGAELALGATGVSGWTRRNFLRWLFEDYPRATVINPRRWQRGVLSRPGAFTSGAAAE